LGLPRSLGNIALYRKNDMLKLPISSLKADFMVTHTREVLQHQLSDPKGLPGQRWKATEAFINCEG